MGQRVEVVFLSAGRGCASLTTEPSFCPLSVILSQTQAQRVWVRTWPFKQISAVHQQLRSFGFSPRALVSLDPSLEAAVLRRGCWAEGPCPVCCRPSEQARPQWCGVLGVGETQVWSPPCRCFGNPLSLQPPFSLAPHLLRFILIQGLARVLRLASDYDPPVSAVNTWALLGAVAAGVVGPGALADDSRPPLRSCLSCMFKK